MRVCVFLVLISLIDVYQNNRIDAQDAALWNIRTTDMSSLECPSRTTLRVPPDRKSLIQSSTVPVMS